MYFIVTLENRSLRQKNDEKDIQPSVRLMRFSKKTILLILIVAVVAIIVSSTVSFFLNRTVRIYFQSFGAIKTVGVEAYWDRTYTNKTESVNWGTTWTGSSQNVTFYLKSVSSVEATLHLSAANWKPANFSEYMALSWDYNGTVVHPSEVIKVTLTLSASSSYAFIYYLITNSVQQVNFDILVATSEG